MSKMVIFSILKDMTDDMVAMRQWNAVQSWASIQPKPEIHLFGNKSGVEALALAVGARHHKILENENGLEVLSEAFFAIDDEYRGDIHSPIYKMYTNADMIYPPYLMYILESIHTERFLMVGQRMNTNIDHPIDFSVGWWQKVSAIAKSTGHLHTPNGMDYFIYNGSLNETFGEFPPDLYVGRWYLDNVIAGLAKQRNTLIIDATPSLLAIHQDHDYSHFPGGLNALGAGDESLHNKSYLPNGEITTILDADTKLLQAF